MGGDHADHRSGRVLIELVAGVDAQRALQAADLGPGCFDNEQRALVTPLGDTGKALVLEKLVEFWKQGRGVKRLTGRIQLRGRW